MFYVYFVVNHRFLVLLTYRIYLLAYVLVSLVDIFCLFECNMFCHIAIANLSIKKNSFAIQLWIIRLLSTQIVLLKTIRSQLNYLKTEKLILNSFMFILNKWQSTCSF